MLCTVHHTNARAADFLSAHTVDPPTPPPSVKISRHRLCLGYPITSFCPPGHKPKKQTPMDGVGPHPGNVTTNHKRQQTTSGIYNKITPSSLAMGVTLRGLPPLCGLCKDTYMA